MHKIIPSKIILSFSDKTFLTNRLNAKVRRTIVEKNQIEMFNYLLIKPTLKVSHQFCQSQSNIVNILLDKKYY